MGSTPHHSQSAPYLLNPITPESSQFIDKIQSMKFNNSEKRLKKNKAETQLEIAKALNTLQQNKFLFADNQSVMQREENKAYKFKRAITQSSRQLKLPHIVSKKDTLTRDISFKVKKVRSSSNNQLMVNPKTFLNRNVCQTESYE